MKKIFVLLTLFAVMLTYWACEKSEVKIHPSELSTSEGLHTLAKALIEDQKSEGILKKMQIALYKQTQNEEFMLVDLVEKGIAERTPTIVGQLIAQNPLMEIAYPSFAFQSNETFEQHLSSIQYYVILNEETDLEQVTTLPAYDSNGNSVQISSTFDETIRYAVIRIDEAHDAIREGESLTVKGKSIPTSLVNFNPTRVEGNIKFYQEATFINAKSLDEGDINYGTVTYRGGGGGEECDRPANKKDQLYKIRFSNKDAVKVIESGFHLPNVELFFTYVFGSVSAGGALSVNQITTQVDKNWSLMNGGNWADVDNINQQIKTWNGNETDAWVVGIVERDRNKDAETSWTFGVTPKYTVDKKWEIGFPIAFSIKKKKGDKLAGEVIIEYCDPAIGEGTSYKVYSGGNDGMYFRENFQN